MKTSVNDALDQITSRLSNSLITNPIRYEINQRIDIHGKPQPFIVHNGQVYINQSMIESATIKVK